MKEKIIITGASGFIGSALTHHLVDSGFNVTALSRRNNNGKILPSCHFIQVRDINDFCDVTENLMADVIIHTAGVAHVQNSQLSEFTRVNTTATLRLAEAAAKRGVRRFIFLSSIGVHGLKNTKPFCVQDKPNPVENYAISKLDAEYGLTRIAQETGMEVVIIRPPLVYGPNAPGNFGKLIKLIDRNIPIPLGMIRNRRSFVSLYNLIDLIKKCIKHPKAANEVFLVSDDQIVSTTELLNLMIKKSGNSTKLIPLPPFCLLLAATFLGKRDVVERLCSSLVVDISHTKKTLDWEPPFTFEEGVSRCFPLKGND